MNDHPPIAPGLKCVRKEFELVPGKMHWRIGDSVNMYAEERSSERIVVACTQRCLWMDVAGKFRQQYETAVSNCCAGGNAYIVAMKNADAWRIWGERK